MYLGHDDVAIEWLEKARAETPKNPNVLSHLAVAYAKKGDQVKAKAAAAELLRIAPNFRLSNLGFSIPIIARGVQKTVERGLHASGGKGGAV
jgi:Flp pilus assembly protein TadD